MSEDVKPREAGSVSCGVGQKVKDAATFPSWWWEGTYRLFALSPGGCKHSSSEREGCLALPSLAASHTANVNPSACPKGLLQS